MRQPRLAAVIAGGFIFAASQNLSAASGYATRNLNPILQPVYLPSLVLTSAEDGWRIDHGFFITNDFQLKSRGDENLIIDVENYRYEFDISHRNGNWISHLNIPLIASRGGELDGLIEDWHDTFGFSQGKRDQFPRDKVNIQYARDGVIEYSQTDSSSGLGDIAVSFGYQSEGGTAYFAGIELPTGSESEFTGNEAIDVAFWLSRETRINVDTNVYGMLGISFPGDDGDLEGLIADQIWVAQVGFDYRILDNLIGTAQLDMHSETIEDSELTAFGESVQIQVGLGFLDLLENHRLDLFFSEDIHVNSAPDITFGLRLAREF